MFLFGVPIPNGPNHFPYDTGTPLQATFPFRNPFWPLKSGGNLAVALLATNATPQHHQQEMWEKHQLKPFLGWSMAKHHAILGTCAGKQVFFFVHHHQSRCFFMARQFRRFKTMRKTTTRIGPAGKSGKILLQKWDPPKKGLDISSAIPWAWQVEEHPEIFCDASAARSVFGYLCHLSTDQSVDPEMKKKHGQVVVVFWETRVKQIFDRWPQPKQRFTNPSLSFVYSI